MRPDAAYEKAAEETAKTIGKLTDASVGIGKFVAKVFAPTIQELANWSHDVVASKRRVWELRNIANTLEQMRTISVETQNLRQIPLRQQGPILDALANEDDVGVQALWVKLLKRATEPDGAYEIKRVHINLLKSIDPIEAKLLLEVQAFLSTRSPEIRVLFSNALCTSLQIEEHDLTVYLHHLASLGCFIAGDKSVGLISEESPEPPPMISTATADFQVTLLCILLLDAIG
ncbi:MAG TPA: hypothetical protein VGO49_17290 [Bradyrhizobium sp.]|jgi:hypothetical protein|nr:hypothetical protein [Bradyrhizobium sp.]